MKLECLDVAPSDCGIGYKRYIELNKCFSSIDELVWKILPNFMFLEPKLRFLY